MEVAEIRTELRRRGLTQQALAEYLGMEKSDVSRLLSGKLRMRLDVFRKIETYFAQTAEGSRTAGVSETPATPFAHYGPPRFVTLAQAKAMHEESPVRPSAEQRERIWRELREIGEALRSVPRVTQLSDDDILGYDETP